MEERYQERRHKEARQEWAEQIERWRVSGQSQAHYCREQGLNPKLFYKWKGKLLNGLRDIREKDTVGVRLVPVGIHSIQVQRTGSIEMPLVLVVGQYKVEIGTGFDAATLTRLINVLDGI